MNPILPENLAIVADDSLGNAEKLRRLIEANRDSSNGRSNFNHERGFEHALIAGIHAGDAIDDGVRDNSREPRNDSPAPYAFEAPERTLDSIPVLGSLSLRLFMYNPSSEIYHPSITATWLTAGKVCLSEYISLKMFDEKHAGYTTLAPDVLRLVSQSVDAYGQMTEMPPELRPGIQKI